MPPLRCQDGGAVPLWTKTTKTEDRVWAPNAPPMWHPFPPRMSREGDPGQLYKEAFTSVEGTADSSSSLPSLIQSTSGQLVL